jgi:hypothetical protein
MGIRGQVIDVRMVWEVVIGGVLVLLFRTDRVVWILPASRLIRSRPADPASSQEQPPSKDYSHCTENYFNNPSEESLCYYHSQRFNWGRYSA